MSPSLSHRPWSHQATRVVDAQKPHPATQTAWHSELHHVTPGKQNSYMTKPYKTHWHSSLDVSCFEVAAKLESYPQEAFSYVRKPKSQWRAGKNNPRSQASHGINMMWPHDATVSRRTGICQSRKSPCKWCSSSVGQTGLKLISTDKPKRMIFIHIYTTLLQCQSIHTKWWPWWICPPCETKK